MGYEFMCGIPIAFIAALAIVLGLSIMWEGLEEWVAGKQIFEIMKNFFVTPALATPQTDQPSYPSTGEPANRSD